MIELLRRIYSINDKYESLSDLSGDKFNFFKLFGLTTKEVTTHSKFIGELLNPKGTHGMNSTFLELFLEKLKISEFNLKNSIVQTEKFIGRISKDGSRGGSIDIFLSDKENAVIIENKILAGDQKNQLLRYNHFGQDNYNKYKLIYLTLYGNNASELSTSKNNLNYECLSYEVEIIDWLEKCKEKSVNYPGLRETITQYIYILKELTNQTNNKKMAKEIIDKIVSSNENIKSFFLLQRNDIKANVKSRLLLNFKEQMSDLARSFGLETKFDGNFGLVKEPTYLQFFFKNSQKKFYISLCFCSWDNNLVYQVDCDEKYREDCKTDVLEVLSIRDSGFNEIWIKWFENDLRNWSVSSEPWMMILDESLKKNIETKFEDIILRMKEIEK